MRLIDHDKLCKQVNDIVHIDMFQDYGSTDVVFSTLNMFFVDAALYCIKENALEYLLQIINVIANSPEVNIDEVN